jgi:hypothetical protein
MEVMRMGPRGKKPGPEGTPKAFKGENEEEMPPAADIPVEEKKQRPKVSLIAAIVVNVIIVITVAIIIMAILLPGYRRSFTIERAVKGADEVFILVKTSQGAIEGNKTDFIEAQNGLRNALQELVRPDGDNVWGYVRDNYADREWVEEFLPDSMQQWLKDLYPMVVVEVEENQGATPSEESGEGQENTESAPSN